MTVGPAILLGALLGAAPAPTPTAGAPPSAPAAASKRRAKRPVLPAASLPTIEGDVVGIDHRAHQVRIRTSSGERTLSFDRDTLVREGNVAATPLQIRSGVKVKVGTDAGERAAWVEIAAANSTSDRTP